MISPIFKLKIRWFGRVMRWIEHAKRLIFPIALSFSFILGSVQKVRLAESSVKWPISD
jgi:hypothetical protein